MTDSICVLPPGWRAFDQNGLLVTDGVLSFFSAGTSSPLPVFSSPALDAPSALGPTVACNSSGYPVSSGTNKTLIYTGSAPYKIKLSSVLFGGDIFEHDGVKGALDSSVFLTAAFTPSISVIAESADRSILAADKGKLINVNCTAGTLIMSLDAAATLGDGFWVGIRHDGTANGIRILSGNGVDIIGYNSGQTRSFSLTGRGQTAWIACDGVGFKVYGEVPALIGNTVGVIRIVDRLSVPPVSIYSGDRFIVGAAPTGVWSTFSQNDIAEVGGNGWFKYTPPLASGWLAFVQSEGIFYKMTSTGWVSELADTTKPGTAQYATQADLESETGGRIVSPATQRFHPAHPKFWAYMIVSAGTPTLQASYNVTSITDTATGRLTVNIAADFSTAVWLPGVSVGLPTGSGVIMAYVTAQAAGTITVDAVNSGGSLIDPTSWSVWGLGDQ